MTITEKTAYLKGLMEGLNIDKNDNTGKLISAIVETLDEMALSIDDIDSHLDEIDAEIEEIEDVVEDLEDAIDDLDEDLDGVCDVLDDLCEDDDEWDDECCCGKKGHCHCHDDDDELEDYGWDGEEDFYELQCPTCGEQIVIDEVQLGGGEMKCPACGEDLEFDLSSLCEEDEDQEDEE